jgi:hypothetical protein
MSSPCLAFDTHDKPYSTIGNWVITSEYSDLGPSWCRAEGTFDKTEITLLKGQLIPEEYGELYLSITLYDRVLSDPKGGEAYLILNGKKSATGKIEDIADWKDRVVINAYSRATFEAIDASEEELKNASEIILTSSVPVFEPIPLKDLDLTKALKALDECTTKNM